MRRPKPPWSLWGWFGEAKPGGFRRLAGFHIGLYDRKVPAVESLSQKSKIFASSLWQGSLFSPSIVLLCDTGLSLSSNRQRGIKTPQNPTNLKRGQRLKPRTRAKAKGQSFDGSTRGILKGGAIRAGASCSPLEPDNFPSFLAGARKEGPAGKRLQNADCRRDSKVITGCR